MTKAIVERTGRFQRLLQTLKAWEETMDYSPYDFVADRLGALEREVSRLRDEVERLRAGPAQVALALKLNTPENAAE